MNTFKVCFSPVLSYKGDQEGEERKTQQFFAPQVVQKTCNPAAPLSFTPGVTTTCTTKNCNQLNHH